jgi:hypothetical protein
VLCGPVLKNVGEQYFKKIFFPSPFFLSAFDAGYYQTPPGLEFKFYLGFKNFGGHLSAFRLYEVRRFFSRFCNAPRSVGEQ